MKRIHILCTSFLTLVAAGTCRADASAIEVDAAVARMASATFKVEILAACGFPKDASEKMSVMRVAKVMALQKDDLSKKLSTDQFVTATLRTMDSGLVTSMQARAKQEATEAECAKDENRALWDYLLSMARNIKQ